MNKKEQLDKKQLLKEYKYEMRLCPFCDQVHLIPTPESLFTISLLDLYDDLKSK